MSEATGPAVPGESGSRRKTDTGGGNWTPSAAHILPISKPFAWQNQKWISDSIYVPVSHSDMGRDKFLVPVMRNRIVIRSENKC